MSDKSSKGRFSNPKGIASASPGLRGTSYPGLGAFRIFNPNGVVSAFDSGDATPLGLFVFRPMSQGSSTLATLGCVTESLWDSSLEFASITPVDHFS